MPSKNHATTCLGFFVKVVVSKRLFPPALLISNTVSSPHDPTPLKYYSPSPYDAKLAAFLLCSFSFNYANNNNDEKKVVQKLKKFLTNIDIV